LSAVPKIPSAFIMNLPARLQDLPPKWAHFCLGIDRFARTDLGVDLTGKRVLAAVSGGADSTALVLICKYLAPSWQAEVEAAHLDHGLRPQSKTEAEAVSRLCEDLAIPLHSTGLDVGEYAREARMGVEEAAREARYEFLMQVRQAAGAAFILTGHHLNDLAEDQVMRLIRGAGWPGLSGMPAFDADRALLRPLLLTPKSELENFLRDLGMTWSLDQSNQDQAWLRNRVRAEIVPRLLRENPGFLNAAAGLWRMGRLDEQYFSGECRVPEPKNGQVVLARDELESQHPALRLRRYKAALDSLGPGQALCENLLNLDQAFIEKRTGKIFQFPGHKQAEIRGKKIAFTLNKTNG